MTRLSRRRLLVGLLLIVSSGFGGCLTLDPTVDMNTGDSSVFENVSTSEPWASGRVRTAVTLAPNATTDRGVTQLTVTDAHGKNFLTQSVDTGQSSGITLYLPAGETATITAVNTINGTTVETRRVTTGGNRVI